MNYNLFQAREIVLERLNMDGSPLAAPTDADILFIDTPQTISFGTDKTDSEEIVNEGPEGPVCTVDKPGKLKSSRMGLQMAHVIPKLRYFCEGGKFDVATGKHTAPFSGDAAPPPFRVTAYVENYADGEHLHGDLAGFMKILMPKCTGTVEDMSGDGSSFVNPNVNFVGKEYKDKVAPENSVPCYDMTDAEKLPSDMEYDATISITDDVGALAGATVTIEGETPVTTDAQGEATFKLAPGVYPFTASKSSYTSGNGTLTVTLLGGTATLELDSI